MPLSVLRSIARSSLILLLLACRGSAEFDSSISVLISVADQRMAVLREGELVAKYPISTSKFGLGDTFGSYKTPLGELRVCEKIGDGLPRGAVMKGREATGEVLPINAPGRDPIVTRILWLDGHESQNRNARARGIYIHGTPEENRLGEPVSWGCIRMRSKDVVSLFEMVSIGTSVTIATSPLPGFPKHRPRDASEILLAERSASPFTLIEMLHMETTARKGFENPELDGAPVLTARGGIAEAMKASILYAGLAPATRVPKERATPKETPPPRRRRAIVLETPVLPELVLQEVFLLTLGSLRQMDTLSEALLQNMETNAPHALAYREEPHAGGDQAPTEESPE